MNPSPDLRLYICGRLAIRQGHLVVREADFPLRHGRRLWVYLVLNRRRPVGRDALAEAIWGDEIPDAWDVALNALVSRLRSAIRPLACLDPAFGIRGDVGRYRLELPAGSLVDYERARSALHAAETLLRRGYFEAALGEARVALEIAGRGFLPGEEAPWITGQRRLLGDLALHALECLAEAELLRGRAAAAEHEARSLIAVDPLRESGYRLLMRALAASGNRAQVIRVMDECRQTLRQQASMTPSDETERLFRQISGH